MKPRNQFKMCRCNLLIGDCSSSPILYSDSEVDVMVSNFGPYWQFHPLPQHSHLLQSKIIWKTVVGTWLQWRILRLLMEHRVWNQECCCGQISSSASLILPENIKYFKAACNGIFLCNMHESKIKKLEHECPVPNLLPS